MRKLNVGNGRYLQGMLTMCFIVHAFNYIPCDFLRNRVTEPNWLTFAVDMILSVAVHILFDFLTKRETTKINGTEVNLSGVNIDVVSVEKNKTQFSVGLPKGAKVEDMTKIINALKTISDRDAISKLKLEKEKKND